MNDNAEPNMGSPAWETLNGDRPLNLQANSQQTNNQACSRLTPIYISPETKRRNSAPPKKKGQKGEKREEKDKTPNGIKT